MAMKENFRNFRKRIVSLFEKNTCNSKRRSRLGVGVQNLNPECPRPNSVDDLLSKKYFRLRNSVGVKNYLTFRLA